MDSIGRRNAKQYVELHDQVETSLRLLDSLEEFLSTFRQDLASVSGQISDLQDQSQEIENRLRARKKIEQPLSSLLSELGVSPSLATTILDTDVDETWLTAIPEFEDRLNSVKVRKRVKAARDLSELIEGLRIVAATKIRAFFLSLLQPLRNSMTTNMQVLQTSILIKYRTLYEFLQCHASDVAAEIQSSYVAAARVYFETGFRRYIRTLGWIKARVNESVEMLGHTDVRREYVVSDDRLAYAKISGPPVVQAYLAEDKAHKEPIEALFRSMLLVLMDNATAEYAFVTIFFAPSARSREPALSNSASGSVRRSSMGAEAINSPTIQRRQSVTRSISNGIAQIDPGPNKHSLTKEEQSALGTIWQQVMEPTLDHSQNFVNSVLETIPPEIPLLTMIRCVEATLAEVQARGCAPLETWLFGLRMQIWPAFQKLMSEHIASLKRLSEAVTGGYFRRTVDVDHDSLHAICNRYVSIFLSFVILTDTEDETMIFSNLVRLRQELTSVITCQSKRVNDPLKRARFQSTIFDLLLQEINKHQFSVSHPKAQAELAYWREREEESRRRITSTSR